MQSPNKEGADPNVLPTSAVRKRTGTPLSESPTKRLNRRRMSKKDRRRVSFAPDTELTMVHHFEKDDDHSGDLSSPIFVTHVVHAQPAPRMPRQAAEPEGAAVPESPAQVGMDITEAVGLQPASEEPWQGLGPGDVTAGVPSLGALAEADEWEAMLRGGDAVAAFTAPSRGDITAAIPGFGSLVEEDEAGGGEVEAPAATVSAMEVEQAEGARPHAAHTGTHGVVPAAAAQSSPDLLDMFAPSPAPSAPLPAGSQDDPSSELKAPFGQLNKWGFVPGDDDTLELDLKQHGRMIMGDRTYNGVYADQTAGHSTLAAGLVRHVDTSPDSVGRPGAYAQEAAGGEAGPGEEVAEHAQQAPDWAAPAFLPPYLQEGTRGEDHPALHRSPDMTNSSLNTLETRRVSVDVRRASITSRRTSLAVSDAAGGLAAASPTAGGSAARSGAVRSPNRPRSRVSDITDNLLDDDEVEEGEAGGAGQGGGLLAGLKKQIRLLSQGSPAPAAVLASPAADPGMGLLTAQDSLDDILEEREDELEEEEVPVQGGRPADHAKTPHTGFSVGSSHPRTAGLLRTGGTTGLLGDTLHASAYGPSTTHTAHTHGTTKLLRMDETSASGIDGTLLAAGQQAPGPSPMTAPLIGHGGVGMGGGHTTGLLSPGPSQSRHGSGPGGRLAQSPPLSALGAGPRGRRVSAAPGAFLPRHSPMTGPAHSVRSVSVLGATPASVARLQARTPLPPAATASAAAMSLAPPGSAIAACYPGSAAATGRLSMGLTPSALPPITFNDFAKLVDVQFLDNLRRGASINYADLQPNDVPSTLREAYSLMCVTAPNVAELEVAIHTLQSETARLRGSAADLEVMLGQTNPPLFRHVQTASAEQLESFRSGTALLKRVCRQKALALLKDVRCQMEESKGRRLKRAFDGVSADMVYAQEHATHAEGVARAAEQYAQDTRCKLAEEAVARAGEAARRQRLAAAHAALAEQRAANAQRQRRLQEAEQRAGALREQRSGLAQERAAAQGAVDALRAKLPALRGPNGVPLDGAPRAVLAKLEGVSALQSALGWQLDSAGSDSATSAAVLRLGDLFRLRLSFTSAGVRGAVELAPPAPLPPVQRALVAAAAGDAFFVDASGVPAAVQAAAARLQRVADLAAELSGVRLAFPALADVAPAPGGALRLVFVNFEAQVRFGVTLRIGESYPAGPLAHEAKVWFDGEGQVTPAAVSAAVARAPQGPGRVRAVCAELSRLARSTVPRQRLLLAHSAAFHTNFQNPLFGNAGAAPAAVQLPM